MDIYSKLLPLLAATVGMFTLLVGSFYIIYKIKKRDKS